MPKCAFLSMDGLEGVSKYDKPLLPAFHEANVDVEVLSWSDEDVKWSNYDAAIIRSTWDYHEKTSQFKKKLTQIGHETNLYNSVNLVNWNYEKTYLKELEEKEIPIVPTAWEDRLNTSHIQEAFEFFETPELIVKPQVSLNAHNTFKISASDPKVHIDKIVHAMENDKVMIQPLIESVMSEGEFSLFYFNGMYSHAVSKHPKSGDFRVQEHLGGQNRPYKASESAIVLGKQIVDSLFEMPLYARVDMVREKGEFLLMELELIEPSLYFNLVPDAASNFVDAFQARMNEDS